MEQDLIVQFVEQLIARAGLDGVPKNFRAEYTDKIAAEVQKRIGLVAVKELSPEGLAEFGRLMEGGPAADAVNKFFAEHIPDLDKKINAALDDFSAEFLSGAEQLKKIT